jgi:PRC-barrel domain
MSPAEITDLSVAVDTEPETDRTYVAVWLADCFPPGMASEEHTPSHLCYLDTERLEGPLFEPFDVRTRHGVKVGTFDGVVVDPAARCVRYLVVDRGRVFHERRLIPVGPAHIDRTHRALRLVDDVDPSEWERFDARTYPPFSDEDLVTAMLARPGTAVEH